MGLWLEMKREPYLYLCWHAGGGGPVPAVGGPHPKLLLVTYQGVPGKSPMVLLLSGIPDDHADEST